MLFCIPALQDCITAWHGICYTNLLGSFHVIQKTANDYRRAGWNAGYV